MNDHEGIANVLMLRHQTMSTGRVHGLAARVGPLASAKGEYNKYCITHAIHIWPFEPYLINLKDTQARHIPPRSHPPNRKRTRSHLICHESWYFIPSMTNHHLTHSVSTPPPCRKACRLSKTHCPPRMQAKKHRGVPVVPRWSPPAGSLLTFFFLFMLALQNLRDDAWYLLLGISLFISRE